MASGLRSCFLATDYPKIEIMRLTDAKFDHYWMEIWLWLLYVFLQFDLVTYFYPDNFPVIGETVEEDLFVM